MLMQEIDIRDYARQLLETHGSKAIAEAAQRACEFEKEGKFEQAEIWRHIEAALKTMRGPHFIFLISLDTARLRLRSTKTRNEDGHKGRLLLELWTKVGSIHSMRRNRVTMATV